MAENQPKFSVPFGDNLHFMEKSGIIKCTGKIHGKKEGRQNATLLREQEHRNACMVVQEPFSAELDYHLHCCSWAFMPKYMLLLVRSTLASNR